MEITVELLEEMRVLAKQLKWASQHLQTIHNIVEPHVAKEEIDKNQMTIFDAIKTDKDERHN